ncbi:MAG: hypothetical protein ACI97N_000513 [Cognaticolwellia sp.]|jgi:hypothetical protein
MKKFLAKEFIWFVVAFILAFPLGLLFLWLIGFTSDTTVITDEDTSMLTNLYILGLILGFIGVYIARFVGASISLLTIPPPAEG